MLPRLHAAWRSLNASYWFLPALLGLGAVLLSTLTLGIDRRLGDGWIHELDQSVLPAIRSEGARSVLTTVATSMITVAGVVFSLTLLVLTQASSQFGPRLLVNFMRDRTQQIVLGIFVATFAYALLVLRVVTGGDGDAGLPPFVPHVSVFVALALTFLTVAVLVYFFHHIAQSVRVTHVLANVDRALQRRLDQLGDAPADDLEPLLDGLGEDVGSLRARSGGYLQSVEVEALIAAAARAGAVVRVLPTVGDFVRRGGALAEIDPPGAVDAVADAVHGALALGEDRNLTQDLGFYFDEFLEIALRALSPSTNDPFTARSCIDRVGQGLLLLDGRRLPPEAHADKTGALRAIVPLQRKGSLAQRVLHELRHASVDHPFVTEHLAATLRGLRRELGQGEIRSVVEGELAAIAADAGVRHPWRARTAAR
jgi:uncharacterized membrane protein